MRKLGVLFVLAVAPLALAACSSDRMASTDTSMSVSTKQTADQALSTAQQALQTAQRAEQEAQAANQQGNRQYQRSLQK